MDETTETLLPCRELVLAENLQRGDPKHGHLFLPATQDTEKTKRIKILSTGPDVKNPRIKPGAIFLVNKMGETTIRVGNTFILVLHENELIAEIIEVNKDMKEVTVNHG